MLKTSNQPFCLCPACPSLQAPSSGFPFAHWFACGFWCIHSSVYPNICFSKRAAGVASGFIITKADIFPPIAARGAGQVALNITLPSLLFSKLVTAFTKDNIKAFGEGRAIYFPSTCSNCSQGPSYSLRFFMRLLGSSWPGSSSNFFGFPTVFDMEYW